MNRDPTGTFSPCTGVEVEYGFALILSFPYRKSLLGPFCDVIRDFSGCDLGISEVISQGVHLSIVLSQLQRSEGKQGAEKSRWVCGGSYRDEPRKPARVLNQCLALMGTPWIPQAQSWLESQINAYILGIFLNETRFFRVGSKWRISIKKRLS